MKGKRIAVVIGMDEFSNSNIANLKGSSQDAIRLANLLQNKYIGDYEVKMFINSASYSVNKSIEQFFARMDREDTVLFYYSGHGFLDFSGRLYFATTDTERESLRSTAISATFVNEIMNESNSKNQIMLLDCCYSGAFARGLSGSTGRVVISSSTSLQVSVEKEISDGLTSSIFTNSLIKGLASGEADINSDGQITCFELFNYIIYDLQKERAFQTPRMWAFNLSDDIIIAKSCRNTFKITTQN